MSKHRALVTFAPDPQMRDAIEAALDQVAEVAYLSDGGEGGREEVLPSADAVLAWALAAEIRPDEFGHLAGPA